MLGKILIVLMLEAAAFAAILFSAAGNWSWISGWVFLFLTFAPSAAICIRLARDDPGLLKERISAFGQKGQPLWDKIFLGALAASFVAWMVVMGLDERLGWSDMSPALKLQGAAAMLVGFWIIDRVFRENSFAAPVVKTQKERGQTVIDTGPYSIVRHPMYTGGAIFLVGCAMVLSSWWGVLGAAIMIVAIAWRSVGEEETLLRELEGYSDYRDRVRWRMAPGVW